MHKTMIANFSFLRHMIDREILLPYLTPATRIPAPAESIVDDKGRWAVWRSFPVCVGVRLGAARGELARESVGLVVAHVVEYRGAVGIAPYEGLSDLAFSWYRRRLRWLSRFQAVVRSVDNQGGGQGYRE